MDNKIDRARLKKTYDWNDIIKYKPIMWAPKFDGAYIIRKKEYVYETRGGVLVSDKINNKNWVTKTSNNDTTESGNMLVRYDGWYKYISQVVIHNLLDTYELCIQKDKNLKANQTRTLVGAFLNKKIEKLEKEPKRKFILEPHYRYLYKYETYSDKDYFLNWSKESNILLDGIIFWNNYDDLDKIAFKFDGERGITTVTHIEETIGAKGNKGYVAHLFPVLNLDGANIRKVSVHNKNIIAKLGLKEGSTVQIVMAGSTIPKIEKVIK